MMKMPHWPIPLGKKPINLGLDRVNLLLNLLDNPQNKMPPVIHVAGTNGKGSTVAFLKAIFEAAGYKVHSYTSPHLLSFNERINIQGADIEDGFLYEILEECRIASERLGIEVTFFEGTTVAAFLAFSRVFADVVIVEVGLGGRLDATNVIEQPAMSIITSIDYDHMDFLGDTIEKIAFEKAGVIKRNCPTVISAQYTEVIDVLFKQAQIMNSETFIFEYDWIIEPCLYQINSGGEIGLPKLSLKGDHQYLNAGNAITAVLNLKNFNINEKHIIEGLQKASWPARLQLLREGVIVEKFSKDVEFWVDGAHNAAAAMILSQWLENQPKIPTYFVFGMTKGRNCKEFLDPFKEMVDHLIGVVVENEPSSYSGDFIASEASAIGINATAAENLDEAIMILKKIIKAPARVIVCGSLYLAGDFMQLNKNLFKH